MKYAPKLRVLVTRPAHQAAGLCASLENIGCIPYLFPTIEIQSVVDAPEVQATLKKIDFFDKVIVMSANAITAATSALLPAKVQQIEWFAIGTGTQLAMKQYGFPKPTIPNLSTSEGLLSLLQNHAVEGCRILVLAGEAGRDTVETTLKQRGAEVKKLVLYRRIVPRKPQYTVLSEAVRAGLDAVICTSGTALENLLSLGLAMQHATLTETACVVPSMRVAQVAKNKAWKGPVVIAESASDAALCAVFNNWKNR